MPPRVMWLLNHTTARRFELPMLKAVGVEKIFLPKTWPADPGFRSASADFSEDAALGMPPDDLAVLNAAQWYSGADERAWAIANRHFDACFFILQDVNLLRAAVEQFDGALLWRAYGMVKGATYSKDLLAQREGAPWRWLQQAGRRLFFAQAYPHLDEVEEPALRQRRLHLPLGLEDAQVRDTWRGDDARLFFVCPDIAFNAYYRGVYDRFRKAFGDLPHAIGGAQPVAVDDPTVLGFQPLDGHEDNMRRFRAMFYHSTDSNHVHYHPFEAVRTGMPLLFMAGGMLDRLGGADLPGRCTTLAEAHAKAARLLAGDAALTQAIRASQGRLLEPMQAARALPAWRDGMAEVAARIASVRAERAARPRRRRRIAVILPIAYRGGTLRGAKLLARALRVGSAAADESAEIVFCHPDVPDYRDADFDDLDPGVARRPFRWRVVEPPEARRAMRYAGHPNWFAKSPEYLAIDDGIAQLLDCDTWVMVSDRLSAPMLPLRPVVLLVFDYVQRYADVMPAGHDTTYLDVARLADQVIVTTQATREDAQQYAGIADDRLVRLPMLAPLPSAPAPSPSAHAPYFIWTTNAAAHKNHARAFEALRLYYDELGGRLDCRITGQETQTLVERDLPHLAAARQVFAHSADLRTRLHFCGELDEAAYLQTLAGAAFLWHAGAVDNGSFSVVEAASVGVPALSSDYAAMREIDAQFGLGLRWMDPADPADMAAQLKRMESLAPGDGLPADIGVRLAAQHVDRLGLEYWRVVRRSR